MQPVSSLSVTCSVMSTICLTSWHLLSTHIHCLPHSKYSDISWLIDELKVGPLSISYLPECSTRTWLHPAPVISPVHSFWQTWSPESKDEGDTWWQRQGISPHLSFLWNLGTLNHDLSTELFPQSLGDLIGHWSWADTTPINFQG